MASPESRRYYQLVIIWLKDERKFQQYLELAAPIVARYGGALERMLTPQSIYPTSKPTPNFVNIVYYDDKDAFERLTQDPDFQRIVHLRSESIDMIAANGVAVDGEVSDEGAAERLYVVELAEFGKDGAAAYRSYERESESLMQEYGYHVERVILPHSCSGLSFSADIAKVAYFPDSTCMERLHADPRHERIERQLYRAATGDSLWIVGRVHPATLGSPATSPLEPSAARTNDESVPAAATRQGRAG